MNDLDLFSEPQVDAKTEAIIDQVGKTAIDILVVPPQYKPSQVQPAVPINAPVMMVLHTRTEITIYPSGLTFQKSSSWFENQIVPVKKKESKIKRVKKDEGVDEL